MTQIQRLLEANEGYAEARANVNDANPSRHLAVVTCMDARIDTFAVLGLHLGEAHVLRNGGGRMTEDMLRSLALSAHFLGVNSVLLMQHTKCGLEGATEDQMREQVGADLKFMAIHDHESDLRADMDLILNAPYLSKITTIAGCIYDVETGRLGGVIRHER